MTISFIMLPVVAEVSNPLPTPAEPRSSVWIEIHFLALHLPTCLGGIG
jgi:hypothetical protein